MILSLWLGTGKWLGMSKVIFYSGYIDKSSKNNLTPANTTPLSATSLFWEEQKQTNNQKPINQKNVVLFSLSNSEQQLLGFGNHVSKVPSVLW